MYSFKISLKTILPCLLLAAIFLTSCNDDDATMKTEFTGAKVNVGNGQAWSYVKTDDAGKPITVGIQFDETALANLPSGDPHGLEFKLKMPTDMDVAPFDHITFDWNEHGHEPLGVYDLPHFDCHFYFTSEAERAVVNPADSVKINKPLPAENMPPQYLDTNEGVPNMGVHLIDLLSPEIAGTGIFTKTFIYGKYNGEITFLEPMLTLDYIKSKPGQSVAIRQPEKWMQEGYYPASYSVRYDVTEKIYTIALEGLAHFHQ